MSFYFSVLYVPIDNLLFPAPPDNANWTTQRPRQGCAYDGRLLLGASPGRIWRSNLPFSPMSQRDPPRLYPACNNPYPDTQVVYHPAQPTAQSDALHPLTLQSSVVVVRASNHPHPSTPPHRSFMRLAEHITAFRARCKQCLPGS